MPVHLTAYNYTLKPNMKGAGNWTEFWVAPARTPLETRIKFDEDSGEVREPTSD